MKQAPLWLIAAAPIAAQPALTIQEAIGTALDRHPAIESAASRTHAAGARVEQAHSGYLPRVSYAESWTRSDNPVFVFGALLTQRQFTASNFQLDQLNRPDFLNNFQSQVTLDQTVFDWGATRSQVRSAEAGRRLSQEQERAVRMNVIARAVRNYYGAALARASLEVAREALRSAEADAARAESIRKAGMSTDADVLSIRVHLASVREQEIRRSFDLETAMAALNESLGLPLDSPHSLTTPLTPPNLTGAAVADYWLDAARSRPEVQQSAAAVTMAAEQTTAARSALLPQFTIRAAFEADRQNFFTKGGANWAVTAGMRWNLFDGSANRARVAEAKSSMAAARAQRREVTEAVRLEVFRAWADVRAAAERLSVSAAAVDQAEESLRITKNRYQSGLTTVTDLLRNETALLEARTRRLAAVHDQRIAAVALELAAGTLSADSKIFQ
jgi:outer membrane protein TolC